MARLHPQQSIPAGLQHGKIKDICEELGYRNVKDGVRDYHFFKTRVSSYRANFSEARKCCEPVFEFPIVTNHPIVLDCAQQFLLQHGEEFFGRSIYAEVNNWPIYPDDRPR
jgi:hypothetical protein